MWQLPTFWRVSVWHCTGMHYPDRFEDLRNGPHWKHYLYSPLLSNTQVEVHVEEKNLAMGRTDSRLPGGVSTILPMGIRWTPQVIKATVHKNGNEGDSRDGYSSKPTRQVEWYWMGNSSITSFVRPTLIKCSELIHGILCPLNHFHEQPRSLLPFQTMQFIKSS